MSSIDEFDSIDSLHELGGVWRSLLAQTPDATFFHSLDWLETYWRHYGGIQRLRVLVVREGREITGIVPLTVLRESTPVGKVRVLTYPQAYWGSYYGPIGPRPRASLRAALQHVRRMRHDWDLLDLRFAPPEENDPAASVAELLAAEFAPETRESDRTSIIDLPPTMEAYLASRSRKWRNNLRRRHRRLSESGEIRHERYRPRGAAFNDADPRWELYADCETVARKSWQGSSTTGTTITHDAVRLFLRDMHATAASAGAADVNVLYLNEQPVAFLYAYHFQGYVYGLRIGFDESSSRDGVGNLLYLRVIEDSIARGDRLFDLGPGSLQAKKYLATRTAPILHHTYGNPFSLKGLLWRAKHGWEARRSRVAESTADLSNAASAATLVV